MARARTGAPTSARSVPTRDDVWTQARASTTFGGVLWSVRESARRHRRSLAVLIWAIVLAAAGFALAACGSYQAVELESPPRAESHKLDPPPPIQPASGSIAASDFGQLVPSTGAEVCARIYFNGESEMIPCPEAESGLPNEDDPRSLPARGARASIVARLPLSGPGDKEALFLVYRARDGRACWDVQAGPRNGSGWVPLGCGGDKRCPAVCLVSATNEGEGARRAYDLVGGTVASEVDEIRVEFDDGTMDRYPATGPLVRDLPGQRVFLLELGDRGYPCIRLLANGEIIATALTGCQNTR